MTVASRASVVIAEGLPVAEASPEAEPVAPEALARAEVRMGSAAGTVAEPEAEEATSWIGSVRACQRHNAEDLLWQSPAA